MPAVDDTRTAGSGYPRQFFLSSSAIDIFDGWLSRPTGKRILYHHPDLPITQYSDATTTITLIGYAIDPERPAARDTEIVRRLAARATSRQSVLAAAAQLAGRWALLAECADFDIMLHDACGLRQVFYSDTSIPEEFCASQSSTAANLYPLEDAPGARDFIQSPFYQTHAEPWWPGDSSRFLGVKCLLPNHYLDLRTRRAHRYGLDKNIGVTTIGHASKSSAHLLRQIMDGISRRYSLALPITAGLDSRTILAACRSIGQTPYCYTLRMKGYTAAHQDIAVPARLLGGMGIDHHVIDCTTPVSAEFKNLYHHAIDPAHDDACVIAEGLARAYPTGLISLSGHCSETARCFYHPTEPTGPVTPEVLARLAQMDPAPFVLAQFGRWLNDATEAASKSGIFLLDLFYWEQRAGRWAANGQAQWDLIHERFTPFNCRPLLLALLSANVEHRRPNYRLYRQLIRHLSREVLREPINPAAAPHVRKRGIRRAISKRFKAVFGIAFDEST